MQKCKQLIDKLKLIPHPEGGHFAETFRDAKNQISHIYYLLKKGEKSHWHKINKNELLIFYDGDPLQILLSKDKVHIKKVILGKDPNSSQKYHFIVIFNHVLMYFNPNEIDKLFKKMYEKNRNCEFVIGVGRQNIVSKLAKVFTFNFKAHAGTLSTYKEQLEIIEKHMKILKYKKNIFFMTDIYYTRFI